MYATLALERERLELLQTSTLVGICYLDGNNRLVQEFDDDPQLREALIEYQIQRVRDLELSGQTNPGMVPYPTQID